MLLAGILGYKIIRMRRGEIMPQTDHISHFIPEHISLGTAKTAVVEYGKKYGHETVLSAIRAWFRTLYFLKRQKEELVPRLKSLIPKKHREIKRPQAVSEFLQSMSEYKAKLKKISDKIKKEEEQNF